MDNILVQNLIMANLYKYIFCGEVGCIVKNSQTDNNFEKCS